MYIIISINIFFIEKLGYKLIIMSVLHNKVDKLLPKHVL